MAAHKPIHSLIIDTGPLIKNAVSTSTLIGQAEELWTTSAIISEIRDEATRSRVETTLKPFLKIRNPAPKSYEAVAEFSKKTGDFAVLSRQDLGILALAYEIHCERHGGAWGLRSKPGEQVAQKPTDEGAAVPKEETAATPIEETTKKEHAPEPTEGTIPSGSVQPAETTLPTESVAQDLSNLSVSDQTPQAQPNEAGLSDPDDDSGGEWITPTNLSKHKAIDAGMTTSKTTPQTQMTVATMTTDFAMQNVLLQMNLNLISTNMQRIKNVRSSIMRCHACFLTTKQMDKQFCPRCGQPTLTRVSCSTNSKGEFKIHLSKNYQWNNRGNKFSMPKPTHGTSNGKYSGKGGGKGGWGRDLILTEDQKEYTRQIEDERKSKTKDLMDQDYLPGILTGDRGRAGGRPKVGAGKNINSRKRF